MERNADPTLVPGLMIAIAAVLTIASIGVFFASGAVTSAPGDANALREAYRDGDALIQLTGIISMPANVALIVAALMLAHMGSWGHTAGTGRVDLPGVWATLAVATLFVLPYDLALARAFAPLAQSSDAYVFAAAYHGLNLAHSVGLVLFYLCTTALFARQATTADGRARVGWRVATVFSLGATVVALGLTVDRPPLVLGPSIFATWAAMAWLGMRMAIDGRSAARAAGLPGPQ